MSWCQVGHLQLANLKTVAEVISEIKLFEIVSHPPNIDGLTHTAEADIAVLLIIRARLMVSRIESSPEYTAAPRDLIPSGTLNR